METTQSTPIRIDDTVPDFKERRYEICKQCPEFVSLTSTCKKCGCFMVLKTGFAGAQCPLNKW